MNHKRTESGQAIILIMLVLVAVLAFMALAVDSGRIYAEHRRLQNAADAAAMAAANTAAVSDDTNAAIQAALHQAILNDVVDDDAGINSGKAVDVIVNNPPVQGQYAGNSDYYEVLIRTTQQPFLTGLLNVDTSNVEAYAVSHVQEGQTIVGTSAVQSLIANGNGITIGNGNAKTTVNLSGGDMFSNSNVNKNSASVIKVNNGAIRSHGAWSNTSGVTPAPLQNQTAVSSGSIPQPKCPTNHFTGNSYINPTTTTLNPGYYDHEIWLGVSGRSYKLNPGIYCLTNGLVVTNGANLSGDNVLLIMLNGELRFNGSGTIKLTRADSIVDSDGNEFGGLLMYGTPANSVLPNGYSFNPGLPGHGTAAIPGAANPGAANPGAASGGFSSLIEPFFGPLLGRPLEKKLGCPTQTKQITLSGSSLTTYTGTIYNPGHTCLVTGASTVTVNGTLICKDITISGTTVNILNNPGQNYRLPPTIELSE